MLSTKFDAIRLEKIAREMAEFDDYEKKVNGHKILETEPQKNDTTYSISAFPGVMSLMVDETLRIANKPQPELSILSALIAMASAIGGNYKSPGGQRFNLYGIGISRTGTGKDKPMTAAMRLAKCANTEMGGTPGSGAGLEDMLQESGTKILLNMDEVAHFVLAMNDPKQTHMATLGSYLLKLFSASRSFYHTRRLAESNNHKQKECINPCVNLLGFACPEKLGEAFGRSSNVEDGLIGRILFVVGQDNIKPQRDHGEFTLPGMVTDKCRQIESYEKITVGITYGADGRLDELLQEFDSESNNATHVFEKSLKTRSYEKCERIAGVLAIWDCPRQPEVNGYHVEWAANMVRYSDATIVKFTLEHMHGGQVQSDAEKIIKIMEKITKGELKKKPDYKFIYSSGYFPRNEILRFSHLSAREFDEAINHLCALERVELVIFQAENRKIKTLKLL
jgi:hypothetical protein